MKEIALNRKQMDFLTSKATNTGFVAGLGSGKSFVATLKTIKMKMENPTETVAYYLPTYGLIRDIAFDKFPTLLSELGIKYKLNKSDKEIHIENFGKIIFRSMDNAETIVGYEVFYSIIDECDILNQDKMTIAYNKIMARNRQKHQQGKLNQIDVVSTPEGFKWFYQRYVKEFNPSTDKLVRASTYDNKHLPPDYIANLEQQYPPNLLKAYLNGEFVNLNSDTVYSYFDRKKHHKIIELLPDDIIHIGQDFNYNGSVSTVFIIRYINNIECVFMIDEFTSKDSYGIVENCKRKYQNRIINIYPDASGNANKTNATVTDIQILRQGGLNVYTNNKNPRVQDRVNSVNALIYKDRFFIDTNKCIKTTEALEQQAYDLNGVPEKFNGSATIDDYNDSLGYFIYYKYPLLDRTVSTTTFIL